MLNERLGPIALFASTVTDYPTGEGIGRFFDAEKGLGGRVLNIVSRRKWSRYQGERRAIYGQAEKFAAQRAYEILVDMGLGEKFEERLRDLEAKYKSPPLQRDSDFKSNRLLVRRLASIDPQIIIF